MERNRTHKTRRSLKQKYLYLSINLLSFAIPFALSFYPKAGFWRKWKYVLPAIAITAVLFIAWDLAFTHAGVWSFNPRYTLGIDVWGLPLEELLFFVCIPYACLFTYFALNQLIERDHLFPHQELISSIVIIVLLIFGTYFMHQLYTGITFLVTSLFLAFVWLKLRMRFMGRLYFAYAVLLIPFFVISAVLTGSFLDEPVIFYNEAHNTGIRVGTIPIEDTVYALLLLLVPVTLWEKFEE